MSNLYNPTKEEVREFLDLAEGNESGIYPDPYLLPTHGLGIRLDDKNDAFLRDYIEALGINPDQQVPHYIYQNGGWIESQNETKTLIEELKYLFANKSLNPFHETQGIPSTSPVRMITTENQNIKAFDDIVYDAYLNSNTSYQIGGISSKFSNSVWEKLNSNERLALYSLNYNGGFNSSVREAIKLYTNQGASSTTGTLSTSQFIGKLHSWISILYFSNIRNDFGIENRRFIEANKFLGFNSTNTSSTISVTNFMEANIAISYMNQNYAIVKSRLNDFGRDYASNPNKYIRDNFSSAVSVFLSNQNYTQSYDIDTLFTEWNLYTDLQINTSTGTTSYGDVTGSDKRDLIFITGEQDGTTVHADAGDDFVNGGSYNDTIYGGNGENNLYGNGGDDYIYGGKDKDIIEGGDGNDELYGDAGSDHIYGGNDDDEIYGGTGRDYLSPGTGTNIVDCGTDNITDFVFINNTSTGVDTIINISGRDYISCAGGFNLSSLEQVGNDVIIYGNKGNKIIIKNVKLPEDDEPENPGTIPFDNMPILYQPDGTILQWDGNGYIDSGTDFPPYDEEPENPEDLPDIPQPEPGTEGIPQIPPVIPEAPVEPEDGSTKTQNDNPPEIPDEIKNEIEKLWSEAENSRSPLVVDLNGDGIIETTSTDSGIYFDFDNNQKIENSGWVGKDDGLLVRDINNNGQIDDGTELFGNNTVLSNGQKATNGFEALKDLDSNNNNVFDSSDTAWNQVKVWKDANQNGKVDEEELLTLEQAGIENIDLTYQNSSTIDFSGNTVGQTGSFDREDGTQGNINDIWFNIDLMDTIDKTNIDIPADIAALPNVKGFGNVHDLHTAMALDASGELKTLVQQYVAETDSVLQIYI